MFLSYIMIWFSPPVKLTFHHHHNHRLDMALAVAEALIPIINQTNQSLWMFPHRMARWTVGWSAVHSWPVEGQWSGTETAVLSVRTTMTRARSPITRGHWRCPQRAAISIKAFTCPVEHGDYSRARVLRVVIVPGVSVRWVAYFLEV